MNSRCKIHLIVFHFKQGQQRLRTPAIREHTLIQTTKVAPQGPSRMYHGPWQLVPDNQPLGVG